MQTATNNAVKNGNYWNFGKAVFGKNLFQKCSGMENDSKTVVPDLDFPFNILSDFFRHLL